MKRRPPQNPFGPPGHDPARTPASAGSPAPRDPREQFADFAASELFCPRCRSAQPVRRRLLLVLPTGNQYDYCCARCGDSVGSQTDDGTGSSGLVVP